MTQIPVLETERLILRAPGPQEVDMARAFYASERSRFVGGPKNADQAWRQLAAEVGHWTLRGYGRWAVEEKSSGRPVGLIGLWNPEGWPEPEIGWDLWEGFEGLGYATEAGVCARAYAYDTLGWTTMISLIAPGNAGSAGVARRLGAWHEKDMSHETFGDMQIWRHPGPDALREGTK